MLRTAVIANLMPELISQRYELLESLGRGGEAEVHRARDIRSGEEVAVRLLLAQEAALNAAVPAPPPEFHPGWVRLLDTGRDPQRGSYQVFELLKGETFRQKTASGPLGPEAWLAFARESLNAVAALHAAGWTHGDLNADNFLLASPGGWKLLELPFLRPSTTAPAAPLFGNIHTLAPEQLEGRAAGPESDVYALGCLYYYGAAGEYPHAAANNRDIAVGRLRFPPDPLGPKAPSMPAARAAWVMALLARDPKMRPDAATAARHLLTFARD